MLSTTVKFKKEETRVEECYLSLEENKTIIHRLINALNKQDLDTLDELVAPDYIKHHRDHGTKGLERFKQFVITLYESFPNFHRTIEDIIAEEDQVRILLRYTRTHAG